MLRIRLIDALVLRELLLLLKVKLVIIPSILRQILLRITQVTVLNWRIGAYRRH